MKTKKKKRIFMLAILLMVLGTGIAYAALSTSLNINASRISSNVLNWNVGFTGTSASATTDGTSSTGRTCGTASISATTVTVANTTLSKPEDSCRYTLTIKNNGSIPAVLDDITPIEPSGITCSPISGGSMVCGNITYKLASDTSGTVLTTGGTLAAGASRTVYLFVQYTGTTLNSSAVTQNGAQFTILYNQA